MSLFYSRTIKGILAAFAIMAIAPAGAFAHYDGELLPDSVAVMEYQMVINMKPDDTLTRNKLGMVYIRQGKLDKAKQQFGEILKIDQDDFDALDSLGIVAEKEGDWAGAVKWYGRALEVRKDDPGVRKRYEMALDRLNTEENK